MRDERPREGGGYRGDRNGGGYRGGGGGYERDHRDVRDMRDRGGYNGGGAGGYMGQREDPRYPPAYQRGPPGGGYGDRHGGPPQGMYRDEGRYQPDRYDPYARLVLLCCL